MITQIINTIQGEGINIGIPTTLVRFFGCNLKCPFCDTKFSINEKDLKKNPNVNNFENENIYEILLEKVSLTNSLLITGGEPFLDIKNEIQIIDFIDYLDSKNILKSIEFETNGTIFPKQVITYLLEKKRDIKIFFNISPKLKGHCYNKKNFYYDDVLCLIQNSISEYLCYENDFNLSFKFIYDGTNLCDVEIKTFLSLFKIKDNIFIMPLTTHKNGLVNEESIKKFNELSFKTAKYCLKNKYRFTTRLQVYLFKDINEII